MFRKRKKSADAHMIQQVHTLISRRAENARSDQNLFLFKCLSVPDGAGVSLRFSPTNVQGKKCQLELSKLSEMSDLIVKQRMPSDKPPTFSLCPTECI